MALCFKWILQLALVVLASGATLPQRHSKDIETSNNAVQLSITERSPTHATSPSQVSILDHSQQASDPPVQLSSSSTSLKQPGQYVKGKGLGYRQLEFSSEKGGKDSELEPEKTLDLSQGRETFQINQDSSYNPKSKTGSDDFVNSEHLKNYDAEMRRSRPEVTDQSGTTSQNVQTSSLSPSLPDKSTVDVGDENVDILELTNNDTSQHFDNDESPPHENIASGDLHQFVDILSHIKASNATVIKTDCCRFTPEWGMVNCSYCNLPAVPSDLPTDIKILLLSHNTISSEALTFRAFGNFSNLTHLWLDSNSITYLPEDAFEGLENLLILNLYNNNISLDEDLQTSSVFYPLSDTLETLIINRNSNDTSKKKSLVYPDLALSGLKKLTSLFIDGLKEKDFGVGFQYISKLRNLTLSGYNEGFCNMLSLSNKTFSYLSQLQHLNISDCNLDGSRIETAVFRPLYRLESLDVSNNFGLGIQALGDIMYGLRYNTHFRYLRLQRIGQRFAPCIIVYKYTLRYFKNTGLEVIEAMDNEIENIEEGAIQMLPTTLRTLNLTNNKISFGAYWRDMASLTGLQSLHLDGYQRPSEFPLFFPSKDLHCPLSPIPETNVTESDKENVKVGKKCICGEEICSNKKEQFALPLPPNLHQFTMHSNSLAYIANNITFCQNNNLKYADLSGNMFQRLVGPIWGLKNLQYLNLSSCFIDYIGDEFFDHFSGLESLNLFQNLLGDRLNADLMGLIFDKMYAMKYLNISFNNIYRLNKPAFQNLINLEVLDLSINRLSHMNFSIVQMKKLRLLDLHKNDITSLPKKVRDHIDSLFSSHDVKVDMRQNPIYCDCDNLDFLEWVVKTKIFGNNFTTYYCKYPTENQPAVEMKKGYDEEVVKLRRQCAANVGIFLAVVGATLLVVVLIIGALIYRFRWTVRYWYHAAKLKISTNQQQHNNEEFEYDVFISYANEDVDFVLKEIP